MIRCVPCSLTIRARRRSKYAEDLHCPVRPESWTASPWRWCKSVEGGEVSCSYEKSRAYILSHRNQHSPSSAEKGECHSEINNQKRAFIIISADASAFAALLDTLTSSSPRQRRRSELTRAQVFIMTEAIVCEGNDPTYLDCFTVTDLQCLCGSESLLSASAKGHFRRGVSKIEWVSFRVASGGR